MATLQRRLVQRRQQGLQRAAAADAAPHAHPTLRLGSSGPAVVELQTRLVAAGASLVADGQFGPKTKAAVVAFQQEHGLDADGVVGPQTWQTLDGGATPQPGTGGEQPPTAQPPSTQPPTTQPPQTQPPQTQPPEVTPESPPPTQLNEAARAAIAAMAQGELGNGVHAKAPGEKDDSGKTTRQGYQRLLDYFHTSAPGVWRDDLIKYLQPDLPHWCGIFALWALKMAGRSVGTWKMGSGISSVAGMKPTSQPQVGDVGYVDSPYQHHFVVVAVSADGKTITSVDGNSGADSMVTQHTRSRGSVTAFYTSF